jgi:hypothetical protein
MTKSVVPEGLHVKLKQIQQMNLRTIPKLPADLRSKLITFYRDDIRQLETLLDRDLSIWLE